MFRRKQDENNTVYTARKAGGEGTPESGKCVSLDEDENYKGEKSQESEGG